MQERKSRRLYDGPAVLSLGFRPFFLAGALWAVVAVMFWLPQYFGEFVAVTAFQPLDWHAHEAIFGFVAAIETGFLLTAVPNWTGRLPVQGMPLLGLFGLWLAGRAAIVLSAKIGWLAAALIDCAFLAVIAFAIAREIIAGKNWRNLKVLALVLLALAANVVFHVEAHLTGSADYGRRFGVAAAVALIALIAGRVVPSFTHNLLARRGSAAPPKKFGRLDRVAVAGSGLALAFWVVAPASRIGGALLIAAGLLNAVRLARWAGFRAADDALVLILHLAYAFLPIGFVLCGLAAFTPAVPLSAGLHAFAVGAVGTMSLAMMTRASLGHTGQQLRAGKGTLAIYASILVAALARVAAALAPAAGFVLLHVAAFAWSLAFLGFILAYGADLWRPRRA